MTTYRCGGRSGTWPAYTSTSSGSAASIIEWMIGATSVGIGSATQHLPDGVLQVPLHPRKFGLVGGDQVRERWRVRRPELHTGPHTTLRHVRLGADLRLHLVTGTLNVVGDRTRVVRQVGACDLATDQPLRIAADVERAPF